MSAPFDLCRTPLDGDVVLLEASAGTGKTFALCGIVLRLLCERQLQPEQILVVTFTVAATDELKARLRAALQRGAAACRGERDDDPFLAWLGARHGADGAARLQAALAAFDTMTIATIHGFCKRLLDEAAFESRMPFETSFVDDEIPLLREAAQDAVRALLYGLATGAAAVAQHAELEPDQLVSDFRQWQRCADTALLPPPSDPGPALAAVDAALQAAAAAFDGEALARQLAVLPWKQAPACGREPQRFAELLAGLLQQDPGLALPQLLQLAPSRLHKLLGGRSRPSLALPLFAACEQLLAASEQAGVALRQQLLLEMQRRLSRHKRRHHLLSFQDLLAEVRTALRAEGSGRQLQAAVQARFSVALIDEFQDTDPLQCDIFFDCFASRQLILVGDPKQSIYGFRGADLHAYLGAAERADRRYTLAQNWRSHPQLVAATAAVFARPRPFVDERIGLPAVAAARQAAALAIGGLEGPPLQLRWCPWRDGHKPWTQGQLEQRIGADVAAECVRLLGGGARIDDRPLRPSDLAVLTRTNAQAVLLQQLLRAHGVHSAIGKAGDIFASEEIVDVERLLLALATPGNLPLLRAAMATTLWGVRAEQLCRYDGDDAALAALLEQVDAWRRIWLQRGFVVMFERLALQLRLQPRLLERPDGERRLTNYLQVVELLHGAEHQAHLTPEGLLQWLRHECRHAEDIDYQRRELRLESDRDAVQLLTVHGSKGLEYEVVFCPFLWSSRQQPPPRVPVHAGEPLRPVYDCGSEQLPAHKQLYRSQQLGEDLRLCYVAMTRARRRLYLYHAAGTTAHGSALAWLLHHRPPQPEDGWDSAVKKRADAWEADLRQLAARHPQAIAVELVPPSPTPGQLPPPPGSAGLPPPRPLPQRRLQPWRISSFTALAQGGGGNVELRDHAEPAAAPPAPAATGGMFAFARGAAAGTCLHEVLEQHDFAAKDRAAARRLAAAVLRRHGLADPQRHGSPIDPVETVATLLGDLGAVRWPQCGLSLGELPAAARTAEWEFFIAADGLQGQRLAALLEQHGDAELRAAADGLRRLAPARLHGFLRGFVDLIACHQGRYYLFDWKSNWLGATSADYAEPQLHAAMLQHDYVLQYLLYALALHRHLRQRLPAYDPARHFGGIGYAFLRGIRDGSDRGLYFRRPPAVLLQALDEHCGGRP